MYKNFQYTVSMEDFNMSLTLKDYLRQKFNFSSRLMTKIKKNKGLFLNGESAPGWIVPKENDVITVNLPKEMSNFHPENIPIRVVYEDEDMMVINKQPFVVVHPTSSHLNGTIANGVSNYMIENSSEFKIRFINRLDRDTSGLLIIGKNSNAQNKISIQMAENNVLKEYVAIVSGIVENSKGTIDLPIGRPSPTDIKRAVMKNGSKSITHYKVISTFKNKISGKGYTILSLKLETGRTHQIRVHLSHMGFPIVADTLYGSEDTELGMKRQALHSHKLTLFHPVTGERLALVASIPEDMSYAIEKLKEL